MRRWYEQGNDVLYVIIKEEGKNEITGCGYSAQIRHDSVLIKGLIQSKCQIVHS